MNSLQLDKHFFCFIKTSDQSPSLFITKDLQQHTESMHSKEGAFNESLYIYQYALEEAYNNNVDFHIFSLGLGLGYNEIGSLCFACKQDIHEFSITSFEKIELLNQFFLNFLKDKKNKIPNIFSKAYTDILKLYLKHYDLSESEFFKFYNTHKKKLILKHQLDTDLPKQQFSIILYDAYSNQTDPPLWEEAYLDNFLFKCSKPKSVFSTYAATGSLNRALLKNDFTIKKRKGFGKKRESTFAYRNF